MKIKENLALSGLTTMRIGGAARYVLECENNDDIAAAVDFARDKNLPWFVLGGGSNVIAGDNYNGVIILNRISGFDQLDSATFKIGAGEIWDEVVARLCDLNLSGVECLSFIPGRIGSFPVQNVGAYGQDISQVLVELTAYDTNLNKFIVLSHDDVKLGYRDSIFKSQENRHYIICDITLKLNKKIMQPPFYKSLQEYLDQNNITDFSPNSLRAAVIATRNSKLPPVAEVPSAGSFFKNPLVTPEVAAKLLAEFPDAPHWSMPGDKIKLAAGWLIEKAGLKSFAKYGFQVYPKNALVITNVANSSAENLAKFKGEIVATVREKFNVTLEQEPESL